MTRRFAQWLPPLLALAAATLAAFLWTPASNAEELREGFARSQHLILDGATHWELIGGAPEMPAILRDFFAGRPLQVRRLTLPGFGGE